jgi:hypothetical protein
MAKGQAHVEERAALRPAPLVILAADCDAAERGLAPDREPCVAVAPDRDASAFPHAAAAAMSHDAAGIAIDFAA